MKNTNGENEYAISPFDDGEAIEPDGFADGDLSVSDNSFSELREKIMRETDIAAPLLDEIFDALAEFGALNCRQKPSRITGDKCQWRSLAAKMLKIIAYIKSHPTPTAIFAALHAWDIDDFDDLNGHMNQKEFAKTVVVKTVRVNGRLIRKYLTKAAVNNAVLDFQKHFNLPPRRDQRNGETKNKQRTVRESQLT